jgi:hypothetical protein
MKTHIKKACIITIIAIVCFVIYFAGYTHGYRTAGYNYYYDGMKVQYAFRKIESNLERMQKTMEEGF